MAKQAIYMEEARRLYVQEGLSLDTIVGMLGKNVARKTLYNWKEQYEWDTKRKEYLEQTQDLKTQLIQLAQQVFNETKANPTQKNLKRTFLMFAMIDKYGGSGLFGNMTPEQKKQMQKALPPETLDYIKSLYGLK